MLITNQVKDDGFGSQYQTIICSALYGELFSGSEYVYTPPNLQHVYDDEKIVNELYEIMNINSQFMHAAPLVGCNVHTCSFGQAYEFVESNMERCLSSNTMVKLRRAFGSNKVNYFDDKFFNVAVHIRRPSLHHNIDVASYHDGVEVKSLEEKELTTFCHKSNRFLPNSYFLGVMGNIRRKHGPNVRFHIYSEGSEENFAEFKRDDVFLHINSELTYTWMGMVFADALVVSPSSFSYTAALLTTGDVYYKTFWHKPSPTWILCDNLGDEPKITAVIPSFDGLSGGLSNQLFCMSAALALSWDNNPMYHF
jgi:hypothetical protein